MILTCGESLIDMLPRQSAADEPAFAPYPGGSVFNTAIALGRLGAPASFYSGLSTDLFGAMLNEALSKSNVDTSLAARSDRPTTLAFVTLTNGQASYAFYDENTAGRMLTAEDLPALPADVSALFFGGISLVVEPCGATYEALMLRAAPDHVTMIDPNIRPSFIRDETGYRARIDRMIAAADVVKISDEDLRWILGDGDVSDHARTLLTRGPALICVTEGAEGARGFTATEEVRVASQRVEVVDTVGAGDTFNAGVLASLHRGGLLTKAAVRTLARADIEAALTLGAQAAAVTVSRAGANPPWAAELA